MDPKVVDNRMLFHVLVELNTWIFLCVFYFLSSKADEGPYICQFFLPIFFFMAQRPVLIIIGGGSQEEDTLYETDIHLYMFFSNIMMTLALVLLLKRGEKGLWHKAMILFNICCLIIVLQFQHAEFYEETRPWMKLFRMIMSIVVLEPLFYSVVAWAFPDFYSKVFQEKGKSANAIERKKQ